MFKDIHWPTCILVNLVLIVLNSTLMMLLNFKIGIPFLTVIGYFISVKIGKAVKEKKRRRRYFKEHPDEKPIEKDRSTKKAEKIRRKEELKAAREESEEAVMENERKKQKAYMKESRKSRKSEREIWNEYLKAHPEADPRSRNS